jgi:hypothetical protein
VNWKDFAKLALKIALVVFPANYALTNLMKRLENG